MISERQSYPWIATELRNVVLDPLQSHELVKEAGVAWHILSVEEEEAE